MAQTQQPVYSCDFENAAEVSQWHLNDGPACANRWRIGQAGHFGGTGSGLYVSPSNPSNPEDTLKATYVTTNSMFVVAYRELNFSATGLGTGAGTYTIIFDRKCLGAAASAKVYWVQKYDKQGGVQTPITMSPYVSGTPWDIGKEIESFSGDAVWRSSSKTFTVDSKYQEGFLVVAWINGSNSAPLAPSACLDNICIYEGTPCAAVPTNVNYKNGQMTWGRVIGAVGYEVCAYNTHDGVSIPITSLPATTTSWKPTLSGSGFVYLYVRAVCADGSHSAWAYASDFVYDNSNMCIDYLNLDKADCYTGTANAGTYASGNYNAWKTRGKVDHGYQSSSSQHTIHYMPGEFDERTGYALPTIPPGELASVRLGNWEVGSHAEGIRYFLKVQAGASDILNLKYAAILESTHAPGGPEDGTHGSDEQAHFYVEVRDQFGHKQGEGCETFDFSATSEGGAAWHSTGGVNWKEWTTVAISLTRYIGQTIEIRLATYDCTASGHYGYAYFTMSCSSGALEGVSCGDFSTDHFTAPSGFDYEWYRADDPRHTVLGRDSVFGIQPTDTSIYKVEVYNKVNRCSFTLTANPNPKFPRSIIKEEFVGTRDCQNVAELTNLSKVFCINRVTKDTMPNTDNDQLDYVIWNWGDGTPEVEVTDEHVSHVYPKTGGTFTILAIASMNGGICVDTARYTVTFPDIENSGSSRQDKYVHVDDTYVAPSGKTYTSPFETTKIDTAWTDNQYGCPVPQITFIHFVDAVIIQTDSIICYGDSVFHDGSYYSTTGEHAVTHHIMPQDYDSINLLNLYVVPEMKVKTLDTLATCGRAEKLPVPLFFEQGKRQFDGADVLVHLMSPTGAAFDSLYKLAYDEKVDTLYLPLPQYVQPDFYTMQIDWITKSDTLNAAPCAVPPMTATLQVCYDSVVLDQKEGFVALLNERYNYGSWTYDSVEWYRDNELLPGENGYYIHVDTADLGHAFSVRLTRPHEVVKVPSCPIIYTGVRSVPIAPNGPAPARVAPRVVATEDGKFYLIIENNDGKQIYVY